MRRPMQRIAFTVSAGFQTMSLAVISVFEFANMEIGKQAYDVHLLSEAGGPVRSSVGIVVETTVPDEAAFDTLVALANG